MIGTLILGREEQDMGTICEILAIKGNQVHTTSDKTSVVQAVKTMHDRGVGCLLITTEEGELKGMITERDVLKRIATVHHDLSGVVVSDIMTKRVAVCGPSDPIEAVQSIMKKHYLRQVPVVGADGQLMGVVSLGDVNSFLIDTEAVEIRHLHEYIDGNVR